MAGEDMAGDPAHAPMVSPEGARSIPTADATGMASSATQNGPYVSIGLKIFTVAVVLLALMCAVTALTVHMAASVSRELRDLGHGYIESYAALARANIRSLERALYLRRLYINARDGEGQRHQRGAAAAGGRGGSERRARAGGGAGFVQAEIAGGSGLRDPVALSRLDTLLEVIERAARRGGAATGSVHERAHSGRRAAGLRTAAGGARCRARGL